jgi:hypothetical protein
MFSVGGVGLAGLLLILGLVLTNRANFATDYVADQLREEGIEFKAADKLTAAERSFTEARSGCVVEYAGQKLTTGAQAECYANEYIGAHLATLATGQGLPQVAYVDGMNFRELGLEQANLKAKIATAKESNDPALPQLEQQLADVTTVRSKMFEGSMLRNALLTTYGFSQFGETAETAATVAYVVAALLLLLSIAGFVHAFTTPKTKAFAMPETPNGELAGATDATREAARV